MSVPTFKVVWQPLQGSQALALSCPANHILYEGSRGPGKTDAQLMVFRKHVGKGYGRHWRGIVFDRQYKNLDDLISKSLRWFPQFEDGAKFLLSKGDYKWVWPTGEELLFRQLQRASDYWNYHGQEFAFIGWNEICKFPTAELFDAMMSCNRTSFLPHLHSPDLTKPLPPIPLVVFATTNPYGPGHGWVKKRFIDPAPPGVMQFKSTQIFNPQTQAYEIVTKTTVRLFGSYQENKFLPPEYIAELENIKDKNKRKAWLQGDWNIVAGGAIDDLWDDAIHVVPRFKVPNSWSIDRSFDWGSTKPFSVGWWALSDGTEARMLDGQFFCPPRGSLIRIAEWYGGDPNESNTGLQLSARQISEQIQTIETTLRRSSWVESPIWAGPADSSIFDDSRREVDSIATEMEKAGVAWERADKSPGSRKRGLQLLRDRLQNALNGEDPGIYFTDNCRTSISQLPVLPRDPEDLDDVDTEAEDHLYDEVRYRCLKGGNRYATNLHVSLPT